MHHKEGTKKIVKTFKKFTKSRFYRKYIQYIRQELEIPTEGFQLSTKKQELSKTYREPRIYPIDKEKRNEDFISYYSKKFALKILEDFDIKTEYLINLVKYHIIYNKFFYEELSYLSELESTITLSDAESEFNQFSLGDENFTHKDIENYNHELHDHLYNNPISLRIHPSISQRELKRFIKNNWKSIDKLKQKYPSKSKHLIKNSNENMDIEIDQRNDFIFSLRKLPRRDILRRIYEKYPKYRKKNLDEGTISKIISLENKLRE